MTQTTTAKRDVYAEVTARIVAQLEAGVRPWHQPWAAGHPAGTVSRPLRANGVPYRGVNVVVLWCAGMERGYTSPYWLTFNQARELGACVRKGEKGTTVVYANAFEKTTTDADTGEETTERIPFLKAYTVFNAEQVDGLPARYAASPAVETEPAERLAAADAFFAYTGADTRHGGRQAFYRPSEDYIQLPAYERFGRREFYYATRAHESVHWTGHPTRLARTFGKRFGDSGYAVEELVAELGAAFVCADLGLTPEVMPDHAAYLSCWLQVMKADSRALFTAAAQAERAADFLASFQPHRPEAFAGGEE